MRIDHKYNFYPPTCTTSCTHPPVPHLVPTHLHHILYPPTCITSCTHPPAPHLVPTHLHHIMYPPTCITSCTHPPASHQPTHLHHILYPSILDHSYMHQLIENSFHGHMCTGTGTQTPTAVEDTLCVWGGGGGGGFKSPICYSFVAHSPLPQPTP